MRKEEYGEKLKIEEMQHDRKGRTIESALTLLPIVKGHFCTCTKSTNLVSETSHVSFQWPDDVLLTLDGKSCQVFSSLLQNHVL